MLLVELLSSALPPDYRIVVREHDESVYELRNVEFYLDLNELENVVILESIYGVNGLAPATTEGHLGDFGPAFESLTGIHEKVFAKRK